MMAAPGWGGGAALGARAGLAAVRWLAGEAAGCWEADAAAAWEAGCEAVTVAGAL